MLKSTFDALLSALDRFNRHHGWTMSSHVALSMMLALFPFAIFSLSVASGFVGKVDTSDLTRLIYGTWPEMIAEPIEKELLAVLEQSGVQSLTVGGLLALFFASNGVDAIRSALVMAYHEEDPLGFWRSRARCLLFVLGGAALMSTVLYFAVGLPFKLAIFKLNHPQMSTEFLTVDRLNLAIGVALLTAGLVACHIWLTGKRHRVRDVLPGVVLTLVLWGVAAQLFGYYINEFATYSVTYAGLASVMAALIFLYLMAALFILGAEFNGRLIAARKETA